MKLKTTRLEALLRKPEGPPPAGLRARTLRRLRLRPAPQPWFTRPLVWAPTLAGLLALAWVLQPQRAKAPLVAEPVTVTSSARNEELAYARRHPGMPGPTTSMQVMQVRAQLAVEAEAQAQIEKDLAASVVIGSSAPAAPELRVAPASSLDASLGSWDDNAARSEAGKDQPRQAYRLTVKGNRIRPALNERVRLELVSPEPGRVHVRLFDERGRTLRDLADLNDPSGPIAIEWDGRLNDGQEAPSGAYTLVVETPKKLEKVGILVIR